MPHLLAAKRAGIRLPAGLRERPECFPPKCAAGLPTRSPSRKPRAASGGRRAGQPADDAAGPANPQPARRARHRTTRPLSRASTRSGSTIRPPRATFSNKGLRRMRANRGAVEQATAAGLEIAVQADDVRLGEKFREIDPARAMSARGRRIDPRVAGEDLEAESERAAADRLADASEADQSRASDRRAAAVRGSRSSASFGRPGPGGHTRATDD